MEYIPVKTRQGSTEMCKTVNRTKQQNVYFHGNVVKTEVQE